MKPRRQTKKPDHQNGSSSEIDFPHHSHLSTYSLLDKICIKGTTREKTLVVPSFLLLKQKFYYYVSYTFLLFRFGCLYLAIFNFLDGFMTQLKICSNSYIEIIKMRKINLEESQIKSSKEILQSDRKYGKNTFYPIIMF